MKRTNNAPRAEFKGTHIQDELPLEFTNMDGEVSTDTTSKQGFKEFIRDDMRALTKGGSRETLSRSKRTLKELAKFHKQNIGAAMSKLRDAMTKPAVKIDYVKPLPGEKRSELRKRREKMQKEANKTRRRMQLGATAAAGTAIAGVAILAVPAMRLNGIAEGLADNFGQDIDPSLMDHQYSGIGLGNIDDDAEAGQNELDQSGADNSEAGIDSDTNPELNEIDYLFDNPGKESANAFGPKPNILDANGNPSVEIAEDAMEVSYKKDPSFTATHLYGQGIIEQGEIDAVATALANNPAMHEEAIDTIMTSKSGSEVSFKQIDNDYATLYFMDKNGDGVPETYYDDTVNHRGLAMVYTNKNSGQEHMYRVDCHFQPMVEKSELKDIPHIDEPAVVAPVEITRPVVEAPAPETPGKPEAPAAPVVPVTPETPGKPEAPKIPETSPPEAPETSPPETSPPETSPPETSPPETSPPETSPPETSPPETSPPETSPPETSPPETSPPETSPPETKPPETSPPETSPPETKPPETRPPETSPPPKETLAPKVESQSPNNNKDVPDHVRTGNDAPVKKPPLTKETVVKDTYEPPKASVENRVEEAAPPKPEKQPEAPKVEPVERPKVKPADPGANKPVSNPEAGSNAPKEGSVGRVEE